MTKRIAPVCNSTAFSHGTLEVKDLDATGKFYTEFLGIGWHRQARVAGGFKSGSSEWYVACVGIPTGPEVNQTRDYRWVLALESEKAVREAHENALANKERFNIELIEDLGTNDWGATSFVLRDSNGCWWEFEHRDAFCYDDVFAKAEAA